MTGASQWSDLPRRLTTICIGVPILWVIWSYPLLRNIFFQGTHFVVCVEWVFLTTSNNSNNTVTPVAGTAPSSNWWSWRWVILSPGLSNISDDSLFLSCLVLAVAVESIIDKDFRNAQGFFLVTAPFRSWLKVSRSFHVTVSLLLTVWNCDTGALLAGRLSKGVLLTPTSSPRWLQRISPNKTVIGLCGGVLGGFLTFVTLKYFWMVIDRLGVAPNEANCVTQDFSNWTVVTGAILSFAAVAGDLWESSCKRRFNVKDTGKLLPGHGGVLDRFDSSLLAVLLCSQLFPSHCF